MPKVRCWNKSASAKAAMGGNIMDNFYLNGAWAGGQSFNPDYVLNAGQAIALKNQLSQFKPGQNLVVLKLDDNGAGFVAESNESNNMVRLLVNVNSTCQ